MRSFCMQLVNPVNRILILLKCDMRKAAICDRKLATSFIKNSRASVTLSASISDVSELSLLLGMRGEYRFSPVSRGTLARHTAVFGGERIAAVWRGEAARLSSPCARASATHASTAEGCLAQVLAFEYSTARQRAIGSLLAVARYAGR